MKKTILSVAISCVLSASAFAAETTTTTTTTAQTPPPCPAGQTCPPPPTGTTQPAPTGTTQPAPTGTTQPAPTGTTQPAPTGTTQPAPTGTTQPAPTGTTQPAPTGTTQPAPTGTTQPAPTGTTQPAPTGTTQPAPTGTTQPAPTGTTQPAPTGTTQPAPTGTTQPAPTGTTQPAPTGTTQPAPTGTTQPAPTGTTQPAPTGTTQPAPTGTTQPVAAPVGQSNPELRALGVDDDKLPKLGRDEVKNLPPKALQAFDKKSLAALPAAAFGGLNTAALKQLNKDEVKQLDSKDLTKLLTNLDLTQVKPEDVKNLLPAGWTVDTTTGKITPPAGSNISLPPLKAASTTASTTTTGTVETPEVADLTKAVAVGGKTDASGSVLQGVNDALKASGVPQFTAKQNGNGVISVEGLGIKLHFLPDNKKMKQGDTKAPAGITIIDGHYVVVTPLGQLIPVIPTPKDPQGLALALGKDGGIKVDDNGVVTISQKGKKSPVVFDSLATPTTATPVAGKPAGVYFTGAETGFSVYADGTAQAIKPAVAAPDVFTVKAQAFSGVEAVKDNGDGSFTVTYKGVELTIKPRNFDTTVAPVATGATVDPSITVKDNDLVYTYQDGTDSVSQTLTVK
ncbi:MAG: hypothetical protein PHP00_13395 [Thiotrichaceae bacterium]|nr:hypothetical protein [Thiotrichaceae bacterium]